MILPNIEKYLPLPVTERVTKELMYTSYQYY